MPFRRVFRKFQNNAINRIETFLRHTATHAKASGNETPSSIYSESVQPSLENLQPERSPTSTRSEPESINTNNPRPAIIYSKRGRLMVCNEDLKPAEGSDADGSNADGIDEDPQSEGSVTTRSAISYQSLPLHTGYFQQAVYFYPDRQGPLVIRNNLTDNHNTDDSSEDLRPEDSIKILQPQNASGISSQSLPSDSSSQRGQFRIRNPGPISSNYSDADDSDGCNDPIDSNGSDGSNKSEKDSIKYSTNLYRFRRPSSRLAKIIEEEYPEIFHCKSSETNPQGSSPSADIDLEKVKGCSEEEDAHFILLQAFLDPSFTTSTPATAPVLPLEEDSTESSGKRPDRHVSWDLPEPGKPTFLHRMTDKLTAQASQDHSGERPSSPPPHAPRGHSSHQHPIPLSQPSRDSPKPRSVLKSSAGPSQPQTLVRKKARQNLAIIVPTITVTPTDSPGPPPTVLLDLFSSPKNLQAPPAFLFRNPNRRRSKNADFLTVVEQSEPFTSCPNALEYATFSSTPQAGPSTPAPTSSDQSPSFVTAPSSPIASTSSDQPPLSLTASSSPFTPTRRNSLSNSLQISKPVKHRKPKVQIETRLAAKRAEVESLTEQLKEARRGLSEVEAPYAARKDEVETLSEKLEHAKRELGEVEAMLPGK